MKFVLNLAIREARSSWRRLAFFFLCIALGVGSIVALRSLIRNFNHVMVSDARAILGSDVQIGSNRPWSHDTLAKIQRLTAPIAEGRIETIESATMLRPADAGNETAMLVELKGMDPGYPFYGEIQLMNHQRFSHKLLEQNGVIVAPGVLERLNVKSGDRVKIGNQVFDIRGVIEREPGMGGFRFGPRVFMDRNAVDSAGLAGFGSRAHRKILLKVPESKVQTLAKSLRSELKSNFVNIRTYKESQENLNEQFTRAENFLSLTGLIILVLGGIGVSSVTRVFIEQKRKTIAVLKCVGATGRKVVSAYLMQILILGLAASFAGICLAKTAVYLISIDYASNLPPNMTYQLAGGAVLQGLGFGMLVTLLFSALPLLRIRHIKPNVLLREETTKFAGRKRTVDWLQWSVATFVLIGLILLSSWQAGSLRVGSFFLGGLLVAAGLLRIAAASLIAIVKRTRKFSTFPIRHAISSLHRPGNQTGIIVMAVGLGCFFMIVTHSVRSNLLTEMDFERRSNLPNMYLIDIQSDQKDGVRKLISEVTKQKPEIVPTVRARIAAINGKPLDPESAEYKRDRKRLGFEYTLTYRSYLDETEKVIDGKFWNNSPSENPEVSIEESLKGMMGLKVGGSITFDVLGHKITARVTSIREVDWKNSRTAFYVLFRPGVLEKAPNVYIAALDAPATEPNRSRFERKLIDQYPNITAIDVLDIVRGIRRILNTITIAISFIGGFIFLSGALILVGSIAMTKFQRIYEAAVLKTLGAKRNLLLLIMMMEYAILGAVAGVIGSLAALPLSYLVSKHVFEITWHFQPEIYGLGILITVILVTIVGAFSSIGVMSRKPLAVLRTQ